MIAELDPLEDVYSWRQILLFRGWCPTRGFRDLLRAAHEPIIVHGMTSPVWPPCERNEESVAPLQDVPTVLARSFVYENSLVDALRDAASRRNCRNKSETFAEKPLLNRTLEAVSLNLSRARTEIVPIERLNCAMQKL